MYKSDFIMYGENNFFFTLVFKKLRITPRRGVLLTIVFLFATLLGAYITGCLYPSSVISLPPKELIAELLIANDKSYLLGNKFILVLLIIIIPATFLWLKHVLIVHPKALENTHFLFHRNDNEWMVQVTREVNKKWIEILGLSMAVALSIGSLFVTSATSCIRSNVVFQIVAVLFLFVLWYIIVTFITKGMILSKYLRLESSIKFNPSIKDDPFLIRHCVDDVKSVIYFIVIGGTVLVCAFCFNVFPSEAYVIVLGCLYFFIAVPFFIIRFLRMYKKLKRKKQEFIEKSKYDNVSKYLSIMTDKALKPSELYYTRCRYNDTINATIMPISSGKLGFSLLITITQFVYWFIRVFGMGGNP